MAMTKRMRVSFSLGAVLSTENVENFKKGVVDGLKEDLSSYADQPSFGNFRVEF